MISTQHGKITDESELSEVLAWVSCFRSEREKPPRKSKRLNMTGENCRAESGTQSGQGTGVFYEVWELVIL